jgi:hypothetical protein
MSQTQINGLTQIKSGSIPWAAMATGAIVPTSALVAGATFIQSGGSVAMAAALNMGSNLINNVTSPASANDAATKSYVDAKMGGIGGIHDVRICATANISSLSGLAPVDGVTPNAGDLVLLPAQTTQTQNGPWVAAAGAWSRPSWWASASVVNEGQYFMIAEGTTNKDTKWWCTTVGTITVDTTATAFIQDNTGIIYSNGTGLALTGSVFSVLYGTTSTTAAVGNDSRITGALQTSALGTGIQTALGVAVGTAGAPVINGGALGTPASGTLTACTGLPVSTGIAGFGTGVAAALAIAVGTGSGLAQLSGGYLAAGDFPALTGDVTNAAGSLATTINVTAGSGFLKYPALIANETPTGTVNGSNATFTLANTPQWLQLLLNGVILEVGSGNDYTISGSTITMLLIPATGDKLRAYYAK